MSNSFSEFNLSRRGFITDLMYRLKILFIGNIIGLFAFRCQKINLDISIIEHEDLATPGGTLVLDSNIIDSKGLLLYRESVQSVKVFSRRCSHGDCAIEGYNKNGVSFCPCHGSKFDLYGNPILGPATSPLRKYNAKIDGNIIRIDS